MDNEVMELIDQLYTMVSEAWGVPLGNEKCIVERDQVLEILDEIKTAMPVELSEAKRLVSARDEFINNAKREAESIRRAAEEKAREFAKAPSGITGLETAFSVCNTYLVQTGELTPMQLVDRMSKAPAEIYGLTDRAVQAGNFARLVLLDWDTEKVYETYKSKGINTPYTGKKLTGSPKAIVTGTKVTE